ncbi:hypothetical protein CSOJ01_11726 [Colletotrichum sojae]|uniref:Uncharacterized protein n=1 Tax=Colletotrichum sojae TaxID=2175907 RepID=A0A8H6IX98_9PEZI|nr:hypothetical protein CSOJ01_11726 [Colletotrichum sojae]
MRYLGGRLIVHENRCPWFVSAASSLSLLLLGARVIMPSKGMADVFFDEWPMGRHQQASRIATALGTSSAASLALLAVPGKHGACHLCRRASQLAACRWQEGQTKLVWRGWGGIAVRQTESIGRRKSLAPGYPHALDAKVSSVGEDLECRDVVLAVPRGGEGGKVAHATALAVQDGANQRRQTTFGPRFFRDP